MKITEVKAVYTGGNIWLFYGKLEDGNYFIVDDDGYVGIFNEDAYEASDEEIDQWDEWCSKHMIKELENREEREQFCMDMLDRLEQYEYGSDNNGGFTQGLIEGYRKWIKED